MHGLFKVLLNGKELLFLGKITHDQPLWFCVNDIGSSGVTWPRPPQCSSISCQHPSPAHRSITYKPVLPTSSDKELWHCKTRPIYQEPKKGMYPRIISFKGAATSSQPLKILVITTVLNFQPDEKKSIERLALWGVTEINLSNRIFPYINKSKTKFVHQT